MGNSILLRTFRTITLYLFVVISRGTVFLLFHTEKIFYDNKSFEFDSLLRVTNYYYLILKCGETLMEVDFFFVLMVNFNN